MNFFFILLLLALIAAGYYVYKRLLKIEHEIRASRPSLAGEEDRPATKPDKGPVAPVPEAAEDHVPFGAGLKEQIMLAVEASPGLAQAEIYEKFPEADRRELQKLLRKLDQSGQLRREKKGSSYRLYTR